MASGIFTAKIMPLKVHENIIVFGKDRVNYYPIKTQAPENLIDKRKTINNSTAKNGGIYGGNKKFTLVRKKDDGTRYPLSVQEFKNSKNKNIHPTQKPVALCEYLIKTYTNEGELILDNCIGSGTTAIAAMNTSRNYIGFEKDKTYFDIAQNRIDNHERLLD